MIAANSKDIQGTQSDPIMFPAIRPLEGATGREGSTLIFCFSVQQTEQTLKSGTVQSKVSRGLFLFKPVTGLNLGLCVWLFSL